MSEMKLYLVVCGYRMITHDGCENND